VSGVRTTMNGNDARACWRSIGVYLGDQSCAELLKVAHCRNCVVFQNAARSVYRRFDAEIPQLAEPSIPTKRDAVSILVLQFGTQWLGLNTQSLIEVLPDRPVRKIAHRNALKLEGLANVRGQLHLVVNVRAHFEFGAVQAAPEQARMILMKTPEQRTLAFRADALDCVHAIERGEIIAPPASLSKSLARCVLGTLEILILESAAFTAELEGAWYA
jgi:chemotaxis-related protein WspD